MPSTPRYTLRNKRIWVAGHRGLVGGALVRRLQSEGCEIVVAPRESVDLRHPDQVERWMREAKPQAVFLAAARVGGIYANDTRPAEFIYDNLMIQTNVVEASRRVGVEKLMLLGSSCIYPRLAPQPIPEAALLTGALEPTNQWYAVAKIAGIKLGQAYRRQYGCDFISVMPTNLYGPGDNFDLMQSHVVPALIVKAHQAKLAQAPMVPLAWASSNRIVFDSWDHFLLPLPFGRGALIWGAPIPPPSPDADDDEIEAARLALEAEMNRITREADHMAGVAPIEPAPLAPPVISCSGTCVRSKP